MPIELTKDGQQPPIIMRDFEIFMEIIRHVAEDLREAGLLNDELDIPPSGSRADDQAASVQPRTGEPGP